MFQYDKEFYAPYGETTSDFISLASQHVMSELKLLIRNRQKIRSEMDHRDSDEDSHSTAASYCNDDAPADEAFIQLLKGLSTYFPLNNQFFLMIKVSKIGMVPLF